MSRRSQPRRRHGLVPLQAIVETAIRRNEGHLAASGSFVVETGQHTGRSVNDKFIVRDAETENGGRSQRNNLLHGIPL